MRAIPGNSYYYNIIEPIFKPTTADFPNGASRTIDVNVVAMRLVYGGQKNASKNTKLRSLQCYMTQRKILSDNMYEKLPTDLSNLQIAVLSKDVSSRDPSIH